MGNQGGGHQKWARRIPIFRKGAKPITKDGSYIDVEAAQFGRALHRWWVAQGCKKLDWAEVLQEAKRLGYQKVEVATLLPELLLGEDDE